MGKVSRILLYVASGFFFYTVALLAFVNQLPLAAKLAIMGAFTVPAVGFLMGGLWASQFSHWKRDIGIVIFSGSLATAFVVLTFICMIATPDFQQMFPENKLAFFGDYVTGCFCIASLAGTGACLIWYPQRRKTA